MSIRKGTPGRGGGSRPDSFSYTPVGNGLKSAFGAWLAGPAYWCEEAHEYHERIGPTKPCLHWLTGGEVRCDRCRKQPKVSCLAWVPLYREVDSKPILVIVHEVAADLLAPLRYPDYCLVGRIDGVSSVFVRKSDSPLSLQTEKECRKRPVDVTSDLIGIWNVPELNDWLRRKGDSVLREKVSAAEVETESRGNVSFPHDRLKEHLEASARKLDDAAVSARNSAEWVEKQKQVSKNGKAKRAEGNGHA